MLNYVSELQKNRNDGSLNLALFTFYFEFLSVSYQRVTVLPAKMFLILLITFSIVRIYVCRLLSSPILFVTFAVPTGLCTCQFTWKCIIQMQLSFGCFGRRNVGQ